MPELSAPYLDAFSPPPEPEWRARVEAVLKGKPFETLVGRTYDGVAVAPLYPPAPEAAPVLAQARDWGILARMDHPDARAANAQALEDLGGGAGGLHLAVAGGLGAYGFGLDAHALDAALEGVVFDAEIPVEVDALGDRAARALLTRLVAAKADPAATRVAFGVDPFGGLARGAFSAPDAATVGAFASEVVAAGFGGPVCVADARLIHAAGGSEAQELGYALAGAVGALRMLEAGGLPLDAAVGLIGFRVAVDTEEFLGVAKLRALRRLWAAVQTHCGLDPAPASIHAETAWRMMTRRDADVNMLRATLAVFAAGVGGADRISVLPHSQACGLPDAFARRVARNIQLVLAAEAHLGKVADPAAGAGGFEALTDALCDKGWAQFQTIEAAGGLAAALAAGGLRQAVAEVAGQRAKNVARRRDPVTGVSEFPHLSEAAPAVLAPAPPAQEGPFAPLRLAAGFEALRDRSDAALAETGARPKVFLATLGSVAAFTARATFAKNLFEAGGFETLSSDGDPASLAAAFAASGAPIACLCSSDAVYAEQAEAAAKALAGAGARTLLLAGRPGDLEPSLRAAGVSDFVYGGGDVLALLESLYDS